MGNVIGIDEVGRGCWAGPLLVIAAKANQRLPNGLADSKILSKKKRESLFYEIQLSCSIGQGWVESGEIDKYGLADAMRLGVSRALQSINAKVDDEIIMDGNINYCELNFINAQCVVDADATHPIVSAASIYAKVLRDKYMIEMATKFPNYQFDKHVGYGTKLHTELLKLHGVCELHRLSYKPVRALL